MIKKLLVDILTTKDGGSFDNGRVLGTIGVIVYLACSIYTVIMTHNFDYEKFGMGLSLTFAGIGVNLKLKENTEPNNDAK